MALEWEHNNIRGVSLRFWTGEQKFILLKTLAETLKAAGQNCVHRQSIICLMTGHLISTSRFPKFVLPTYLRFILWKLLTAHSDILCKRCISNYVCPTSEMAVNLVKSFNNVHIPANKLMIPSIPNISLLSADGGIWPSLSKGNEMKKIKKLRLSHHYTFKRLPETCVQQRCETSFTKWCYTEKLLFFHHCDRCEPLQMYRAVLLFVKLNVSQRKFESFMKPTMLHSKRLLKLVLQRCLTQVSAKSFNV